MTDSPNDIVNDAEEEWRLLDAYRRDLDTLQRLDECRTKELLVRMNRLRSTHGPTHPEVVALRNEVVEGWLGLAVHLASSYSRRIDLLDAMQIASTALIEAVNTVDVESLAGAEQSYVPGVPQGRTFQGYVRRVIRTGLLQHFDYHQPVNMDAGAVNKLTSARKRMEDSGTHVSLDTLAKEAGMSMQRAERILGALATSVSLSDPIKDDHGNATDDTISDTIADPMFPSPEEQLLRLDDVAAVQRLLDGAKPALTDTERTVIRLYFGLGDGVEHSLSQIARILDLTIINARTVRDNAVRKLKRGAQNAPVQNEDVACSVSEPVVKNHLASGMWKVRQGVRSCN